MLKVVFTRKNLMAIALACLYSFLMVFVGFCIDGSYAFMSAKNPINQLALGIGLQPVTPTVAGYVALGLLALFIAVFVAAVIYERRVAIVSGKNPNSPKMIMWYAITFLGCMVLSLGIGTVIQSPLNGENLKVLYTFIWNCFALSLLLYAVLFVGIGAIVMLVVNFLLVDKPFKFFTKDEEPVFDDDDVTHDISGSFDIDNDTNVNGFGGGSGSGNGGGNGGGGFGDEENSVVAKSAQLDDRERVFPELSSIDESHEGYDVEPIQSDEVSLSELAQGFRNYLAKNLKLYFDIDTIRFFISGFGASHFEILEGLSGTGKSSLPRYFCEYVGGKVLFMPVQATWRDKSSILGFFNEFSQTYSETEFLTRLYESNFGSDEINVYVLDEMNISRVEYYFADLLSVLEYPVPDWKLKIMNVPHTFVPPIKLEGGYVQIPENSYFVGTANRDDSTFTITDKVYDRAITINFETHNEPFTVSEEVKPIKLSGSYLKGLYDNAKASGKGLTQEDRIKLRKVLDFVYGKFELTIGNRILNQIEQIVPVFAAAGGTKEDAIDFMLCKKLFAKLEGRFEDYVKSALGETLEVLAETYGAGVLKRSESVIRKIEKSL